MMQKNHISRYINNRIVCHGRWYLSKNHLKTTFDVNHTDENIFYLLYFVVLGALEEGNTVLILKQSQSPYKHLSNWQYVLLEPFVSLINDELSGLMDFQTIFHHIDELKANPDTLALFIQKQKENLANLYQQSKVLNTHGVDMANVAQTANHVAQLENMLLWALRFYFYSKHKLNNSLSAFIERLQKHCLLADAIGGVPDKPLVFYADTKKQCLYVWLNRIYQAECVLLACVNAIAHANVLGLSANMPNGLNNEQKQAVQRALTQPLSIITGGPGTGKTFTVAQIVMALYQQQGFDSLALVAPTGKAAQRMKESLQHSLGTNISLPSPMTIHRLLGMGVSSVARYHQANPLPYEVIIVDEASMLGVELASALLSAVKQGARVILLGDIHQLSAVEAGSVLADLCQLSCLNQANTALLQSQRFDKDSGVGQLARLVNQPHKHSLQEILSLIDTNHQTLSFINIEKHKNAHLHAFYAQLLANYAHHQGYFWQTKQLKAKFYQMNQTQQQRQVVGLIRQFNDYRILTASHLSLCGDEAINNYIQNMHKKYLGLHPNKTPWYHGRPVMVLKNRYDLGLFNGDIGICLQSGSKPYQLSVYFDGDDIKAYPVGMLDKTMLASAYAMTVHKSQGSEFDAVAVVFDDDNQRLLCKELIYTAITRAKQQVSIYSTPSALLTAINTQTVRQTGLTVIADSQNTTTDGKDY